MSRLHPDTRADAAPAREQVLDTYRRHVSMFTAQLAEVMQAGVEARSLGAYIWDEAGERYLDCGGYGVFTVGHCHPHIVEAVVRQVRTNPTASILLINRLEAEAAEALARVAPKGLDHVHFGLSGADAVETAIKVARLGNRRRLIAMQNGYHGMTLGALSVMGFARYREPFEPLLPDAELVPFGDAAALEAALARGPQACVMLEPVQGEAGVIVPPDGYLRAVETACRAHDAFLVVDEIQTGLGRLGAWWGVDREGITPDVLLVGKALGGGIVPVSAAVGSARAFHRLTRDSMLHTSTFSGAPIAMAAAKATLEVMAAEDIPGRAAALAPRLHRVVATALAGTCPTLVRAVRASGLLVAIEWDTMYQALDFLVEMLARRVVLATAMNAPRVARLTPPAILAEDDLGTLEAAVRASGEVLANRYA